MSDYPGYEVIVEGEGPIPYRINSSLITNSDQGRQAISRAGYTIPSMFYNKWNAQYGRGEENKNGQTWLEYMSKNRYGNEITLIIIRMWYDKNGECLCDEN